MAVVIIFIVGIVLVIYFSNTKKPGTERKEAPDILYVYDHATYEVGRKTIPGTLTVFASRLEFNATGAANTEFSHTLLTERLTRAWVEKGKRLTVQDKALKDYVYSLSSEEDTAWHYAEEAASLINQQIAE
ncbi:MAG: hypothetical protein LBJ11_01535 [Oscillospiraceae bacterium]|jgi:hypothetical protein|nr:hypothetical protein [Oscillospiraceae bacterium]